MLEHCLLKFNDIKSIGFDELSGVMIQILHLESQNFFSGLLLDHLYREPFVRIIDYKDDYSDESFESTDESDVDFDSNDYTGIKISEIFHSSEVVWAKRALLPWFPGIVY